MIQSIVIPMSLHGGHGQKSAISFVLGMLILGFLFWIVGFIGDGIVNKKWRLYSREFGDSLFSTLRDFAGMFLITVLLAGLCAFLSFKIEEWL